MKSIIVYQGKYGATRQYAEWIGGEFGCPVIDSKTCTEPDLADADVVLLGSSVYIGKLQISTWLKRNERLLRNKKLFLFVISGTPLNEKEKLEKYVKASVDPRIMDQCHIYFLPGRLIYQHLSGMDKFLLRMGAWLSGNPKTKKAMTDYDSVRKENLTELLNDLRLVMSPAFHESAT